MTNKDIVEILKMRMAVYAVGIQAGEWKDIDTLGASDMMDYLFPKSGKLAFYQLLMEQMRTAHDILTGGVYYLFKMPVQVEKEISEYLKKEETDIKTLVDDAEGYLASMDTIPTDHCLTPVNIGAFSMQEISNLLRLCASHYRYSFNNHLQSYPYFE